MAGIQQKKQTSCQGSNKKTHILPGIQQKKQLSWQRAGATQAIHLKKKSCSPYAARESTPCSPYAARESTPCSPYAARESHHVALTRHERARHVLSGTGKALTRHGKGLYERKRGLRGTGKALTRHGKGMEHEGAYAAREGDGEALRGTGDEGAQSPYAAREGDGEALGGMGDEGAQSPYATQEGDGEALGGTGAHEHNAIRRT